MTIGLVIALAVAGGVAAGGVIMGTSAVRGQLFTMLRSARARLGWQAADRLPPRWRRGLAGRLVAAGSDPGGVGEAVGLRLMASGLAVGTFFVAVAFFGGRVGLAVGASGALVVAAAPEAVLARRISVRRDAMARDLPRMLDLLVISVEAGLGLDQALARVVGAVPGQLANEFARLLAEVGAGVPRGDALRSLASRCPVPELRSFALAMVQADAYGVSVGPLLRSQAEEIRTRQRQRIQMQAQKAPVKLLVPMVLCIFPALLVVVAGPALLSVRSLIGG